MNDLIECLCIVFGLVVALASSIFICLALWAALIGPPMCSALGEGMSAKTEYLFWSGCFVTMPDGRVLPQKEALDVLKQEYKLELKQR